MVGLIGIIFVFLPESPWWLASKGKLDKAKKVLQLLNGDVKGYDIQEQIVSLNIKFQSQLGSQSRRDPY